MDPEKKVQAYYLYTTIKMGQFFDLCFLDSTGEYATHTYVKSWLCTNFSSFKPMQKQILLKEGSPAIEPRPPLRQGEGMKIATRGTGKSLVTQKHSAAKI